MFCMIISPCDDEANWSMCRLIKGIEYTGWYGVLSSVSLGLLEWNYIVLLLWVAGLICSSHLPQGLCTCIHSEAWVSTSNTTKGRMPYSAAKKHVHIIALTDLTVLDIMNSDANIPACVLHVSIHPYVCFRCQCSRQSCRSWGCRQYDSKFNDPRAADGSPGPTSCRLG